MNAAEDVRLVRRPATGDELRKFLAVTSTGKPFRGLTGGDRAILYRVAVETGLRASELASLTTSSLDLDARIPTITVAASYCKRRRLDVQPIRQEVSDALREWLRLRHAEVLQFDGTSSLKLWPGTWFEKAAKMLQRDLEAAGLEVETEDGRIDFHCLRGTFATNLALAGVSPKATQELMRHSDINLTMMTYTNLRISDVAADLNRLPSLVGGGDPMTATGTAGREILVAPKVALLASNFNCSQESSGHCSGGSDNLVTEPVNSRFVSTYENLRASESANEKGPSLGLEPRTYALRKRRSTD